MREKYSNGGGRGGRREGMGKSPKILRKKKKGNKYIKQTEHKVAKNRTGFGEAGRKDRRDGRQGGRKEKGKTRERKSAGENLDCLPETN